MGEARRCYEHGLALDPGQVDALFLLGQVLFETGDAVQGEERMRQALTGNPRAAHYWLGLGIQLYNGGRYREARDAFEQAVRLSPSDPEAAGNLALACERLGERLAAIESWRRVCGLVPASIDASSHLARLLALEERDDEALAFVERWLVLAPADASAYALRADLHEKRGEAEKMLADRVQAATCAPSDAMLRGSLALALMKAGLTDEALVQFDDSVGLAPENAQLHFNRGVAYANTGHPQVACQAYEAALRIVPDSAEILCNLANQYAGLARNEEARALYERAIALQPAYAPAYFNLGMLCLDEGRRLNAAEFLQCAADLRPDDGLIAAHLLFQKMHLCRWDGLDLLSQCIRTSIEQDAADIPPFIVLSMPGTTPQLQRRCAENHSARLSVGNVAASHGRGASDRRLRVGYLSADFKNHATTYLLIEMLEAHDQQRFEVFSLSYGSDDHSDMRQRVENGVEHFVELAGLPTNEAVARIAALDLDILIDLKGYTEGNHSEWLQYRLAPVQVNWLGYPGTLGAPWVDYLIADEIVAPMENQWMFNERLLHLPGCYQSNCRARQCGRIPARTEEGLSEEAIVLCSFNQSYKITPEMFLLWLDVLREVPETVLWLWASNPWAEVELRKAAANAGVEPSRIVFAEGRPQAEHLARLELADLALDTFPCNGHTTTADALWAGVPVVTLRGEAFAARVAASLLHANGLDELIATTPEEYRHSILRYCRDIEWRERLIRKAQGLRMNSAFFDGEAFARKFETLLQEIAPGR